MEDVKYTEESETKTEESETKIEETKNAESDVSESDHQESEDDLEFISAESVKDKSKMAKVEDGSGATEDGRKTARRSVDLQESQKEKKKKFFRNHKILLAILIVIIIVAIIVAARYAKQMMDQKAEKNKSLPLSTQEYEKDENEEISELIAEYYDCYAQGDTEAILKYAYPMTDNEKSYIQMFATYIQEYQNIVCYTKTGLDDTSYIVSAAFDLKYKGINSTAPGLDFFYVRTADDGSMYIDNVYSPFNLTYQENTMDPEILQLITDYQVCDDVTALLASVQIQYEDAVASDDSLSELVDITIPNAVTQWKAEIDAADQADQQAAEQQVQQDAASDAETSQTAAETPAADTGVTETEQKAWVYVKETVNIRQTPDENGTVVASAFQGSEVRQTAVTDTGWSKVYTGDVQGYIKTEYLSTEQIEADSTSSGRTVSVGDNIYLTASVNIRKSMSETAGRVGLAYSGETVTVEQVYVEGWCKVTWNGQTGYVKTEVLEGM